MPQKAVDTRAEVLESPLSASDRALKNGNIQGPFIQHACLGHHSVLSVQYRSDSLNSY